MIEPLRISLDVRCAPEHAFRVWTAMTSLWWPPSHTATGEEGLEVILEPRAGGRVFQRSATGQEIDWGEVIDWDPPRRFTYLWHLRVDRADATEVEIRFEPAPEGRTRVEIEHRRWEQLGALGRERRDANMAGWGRLLPHFVALAESSAA